MQLSPEDALRLNVLLANKPLAVRINDSRLVLDGLLEDREISIQLNPTGPAEKYMKSVRAVLSEYALGTPGGYPLYLQRWTRMSTMRDESLESLLLIGEPTAVFAVVCAKGLTEELARRAWWASEEAENARRMLETEKVVNSQVGVKLARYLVEFLPFETDSEKMTESVSMALQGDLLNQHEIEGLWKKSSRKGAYMVGFLIARPHDLPVDLPPREYSGELNQALGGLAGKGNAYANLLLKVNSKSGQGFLDVCVRVLTKPNSQDVVASTLWVIARYFSELRCEGDPDLPLNELVEEAEQHVMKEESLAECLELDDALRSDLVTMRFLSGLGYGVVRPIFRRSDAIGSLMRKQLKPVLDPLMLQLDRLRGQTL